VSPAPEAFLSHLRAEGYHSRSNKHSNALALAIVADLAAHCPAVRAAAARGELVFDLNFRLRAGTADWNVDLVLGAPELGYQPSAEGTPTQRQTPATIQIAIEIKTVMTEHRKAIKNRKRDLEAHHEHVHNYNQEAIAGGVLVINSAAQFRSPLRNEPTMHRNPLRLVEHCLAELRAVASRDGPTGYGLEAKCAIVVDMDNENLPRTRYVSSSPAPPVGDPLHYDGFIRALCQHYMHRFGRP
jgi:hypothetical protein